MKTFDAWELVMLLHHLCAAEQQVERFCNIRKRDDRVSPQFIGQTIEPVLLQAYILADKLKLQSVHDRIWDNGPFRVAIRVGRLTFQELQHELKVLRESLEADFDKSDRMFVFIPPDKATVYEQMTSAWAPVWKQFPNAVYDTTQAVGCYAVEHYTASIFHFMRVTEVGLRALARRMKVTLPKRKQLEWAQWLEILKAMSAKADAIQSSRKAGRAKDELLEFYRGAIGEFMGFKDAYRNHVMHARKNYDLRHATRVLTHVTDFMQRLAERIDERGRAIASQKEEPVPVHKKFMGF